MNNKIEYKDLITFHPGYYVKDLIEDQGISQEELAKRLQTSPKYVSDLVNGRINLTEEMVLRLSAVFGTSTTLWLNLNQRYLEKKFEIEKQKRADEESALIRLLDYHFWVKLGLVKEARSTTAKAELLQNYFKVSSLHVLQERDFLVQYRTSVSDVKDINVINANAWVQTALNIGQKKETALFDKKKLSAFLPELRSMTVQSPSDFMPNLNKILSECGVALVILPNLRNCGINGAVKWYNKNKVVLALNDRGKYADLFWFAFFHELGHVFQQRLTMLIVSEQNADGLKTDKRLQRLEEEANSFSRDILIPEANYKNFLSESGMRFTAEAILSFAEEINILPGIVVGRLLHDKYLKQNSTLNSLRIKYHVA